MQGPGRTYINTDIAFAALRIFWRYTLGSFKWGRGQDFSQYQRAAVLIIYQQIIFFDKLQSCPERDSFMGQFRETEF